jgi:hypothetical protein
LTAAPRPYFPVRTVDAGASGPQRLDALLDLSGEPVWQPGDTNVARWEIDSVGYAQGPSRNDYQKIKGQLYLTDSRIVAVSADTNKGSRYQAYGVGSQVIAAAVATKVSQVRAARASAGKFLVGHMRLPWIADLYYSSQSAVRRSRGELRISSRHKTAFGDIEPTTLIFRLTNPRDAASLTDAILARIRADRYPWENLSQENRTSLQAVPSAVGMPVGESGFHHAFIPGGYLVGADTAARGFVSRLSFI